MPSPTRHLTEQRKRVLAGFLLVALGMAGGVVISGDDEATRDAKLDELGSALAGGSALSESDLVDTRAYHEAMRTARRGRHEVTDLPTAPVPPGMIVTTEVALPRGSRIDGPPEYVGPAGGRFETVAIEHQERDDATVLRITARNVSTTRLRMTALVQFASPPPDGTGTTNDTRGGP